MRRLFTIALLALILPLTACNTFEGMGRDVQKGGQAVENTATDLKN